MSDTTRSSLSIASGSCIARSAAVALWQRELVTGNLVIGLAGDIDEVTSARVVARLPRASLV